MKTLLRGVGEVLATLIFIIFVVAIGSFLLPVILAILSAIGSVLAILLIGGSILAVLFVIVMGIHSIVKKE